LEAFHIYKVVVQSISVSARNSSGATNFSTT
jgi:hypothetical protein